MTCEFIRDESGKVVMIACGSPWGIGVYKLNGLLAQEFGDSMYGFPPRDCLPHDFSPDEECCTPGEIIAWREACAAYDKAVEEKR